MPYKSTWNPLAFVGTMTLGIILRSGGYFGAPDHLTVVVALLVAEESAYFVLDRGDYDMCSLQIERILLLIRLGSESTDKSYDLGSVFAKNHTQSQITEDEDYIYIFTPPQQVR